VPSASCTNIRGRGKTKSLGKEVKKTGGEKKSTRSITHETAGGKGLKKVGVKGGGGKTTWEGEAGDDLAKKNQSTVSIKVKTRFSSEYEKGEKGEQ